MICISHDTFPYYQVTWTYIDILSSFLYLASVFAFPSRLFPVIRDESASMAASYVNGDCNSCMLSLATLLLFLVSTV